MIYSYSPYDTTLKIIRLLYWSLFLLFVAALLLASGALTHFEDGSFILRLGSFVVSGCINPICWR